MLVSARRLTYRPVRFRDRKLTETHLFPIFDRDGAVQRVLLVWLEGRRLLLVNPIEIPVRVPWFGAVSIDGDFGGLCEVDPSHLPAANLWWHWDSWWMLRKPLWTAHPAVPALRATNACEYIGSCYFDRKLLHLQRVADHLGHPVPHDPASLPSPQSEWAPSEPSGHFRLDPIWIRPDWPMAVIRGTNRS